MIYDILNDGGTIAGELGLGWSAYAMNEKGYVWQVGHVDAESNSVNDQLTALYKLQLQILNLDRDAKLADVTITGESLSLPKDSKSPVKQWILAQMKKP